MTHPLMSPRLLAHWHWLDDHLVWIPLGYRLRFVFWTERVRQRWHCRVLRARYLYDRFTVLRRLRPVWVAFHGHCCDTGPFTWTSRYGWEGWCWPGLLAWQATNYNALEGASDGSTDYSLVPASEVDHYQPHTCQGCGAGNAPYGSSGYHLCAPCEQRERWAD